MKKIIATLICVLLLVSCFTVTALAAPASKANITVTASASEVKDGDTVTFTVLLTNADKAENGVHNYDLNVTLGEGLTFVEGSVTAYGDSGFFGIADSIQVNGNTIRAFSYGSASAEGYNSASSAKIFSFQCTVTGDPEDVCTVSVSGMLSEYVDGVLSTTVCGGGSASVKIPCDHNYIGTPTTPATCTTEGVMTYTCEHCGDSYTEAIAKLAHTAAEGWEHDEDYHWQICSECKEVMNKAEHEWEKVVDKNATATQDGYGHYECECGREGEEYTIPATGEELDDVPFTGDITNYVVFSAVAALVVLLGIAVLVFKRKRVN